ncbi:MAG TPA: PPC domain-containing DNA-binding protein [Devosia sp.]|nr:PPC domain-containing DNA-binding protein [Devosia sp.]
MQSKLIHDADGQQTYAIVLSTGDEVSACLQAFALEAGLQAASFKAIGAFQSARLAFFDWEAKSYIPIEVNEQVEVASLTGDVAIGPDGKPALHIHAVLGRRDGSAVAGHLQRAQVRPTLEVILTESPEYLRKTLDPDVGLALIKPNL